MVECFSGSAVKNLPAVDGIKFISSSLLLIVKFNLILRPPGYIETAWCGPERACIKNPKYLC